MHIILTVSLTDATGLFLYPLKTLENHRGFHVV